MHRRLSRDEAAQRFTAVQEAVLSRSPTLGSAMFERLTVPDLRLLWQEYDQRFFDGALSERFARTVDLDLSRRMRSSGGRTQWHKREGIFTITLAENLLLQTFSPGTKEEVRVCGVLCRDRLSAAQRIFEHELCHLAEFAETGHSSCRKPPFQAMAEGLFHHREHRHDLTTAREVVEAVHGIRVGDAVRFAFRGRWLRGTVGRVTKRATVYVPDAEGAYVDRQGRRLAKYYVPVADLRTGS